MQTVSRLAVVGAVAVLFAQIAAAAEPARATPSPEQVKFFESKVRPLLSEHCYSCHGEKKQKGGLRLDSAEAVARGGKDGQVVVPGKPAESKLVVAVGYRDEDLQ